MIRTVLTLAFLAATPGLALAQGGPSATRSTTPGPTSDPATTNPSATGTAGAILTTPQSAPPASPVPATTPSGAPPDVIITPR